MKGEILGTESGSTNLSQCNGYKPQKKIFQNLKMRLAHKREFWFGIKA